MTTKQKAINIKFDRLAFLMLFLFLLSLLIIVRLFKLQVLDYEFYSVLASDQHQIYKTLVPTRGEIFVKDEFAHDSLAPLVINKDFYFVYAVPRSITDPVKVTDQLMDIFGWNVTVSEEVGVEEYAQDLQKMKDKRDWLLQSLSKENDPYEPIQDKVNEDIIKKIDEQKVEGIQYRTSQWRYYVEQGVGAQLSGFLGKRNDELVGLYGIEGYFNDLLTGQKGELKTEKDATGKWIVLTEKRINKAVNGADLILTIDRTVQYEVCARLASAVERFQAEGGSVIVANPYTGAIIAMCSVPTYDPNEYNKVDDISVYNNAAIFNDYEPGSIFKAITMAAAIDQGKVTPDTTFEDTGAVKVDRYTIRNADDKVYGTVSMTKVLEDSINTGVIFATKQIGNKKFHEYVQDFGFGSKTGIELDTESAGNIHSLESEADIYSFTASFGQGITTTPLQMLTAYGAIANGGLLMKPYVVDEIHYADGRTEHHDPVAVRRVVSERTSVLMGAMLESVVKFGHAKGAQVAGYAIAGKTGTAQVASANSRGYSDKTIHSFAGYGPVENPVFVMMTRLDKPAVVEYSASTAAPLFGEIAEFLLRYYKIPTR